MFQGDYYGLIKASERFPYNRTIRMRPAYQTAITTVSIAEAMLRTDPWAQDLANAIATTYWQNGDTNNLEAYRVRLMLMRGLTSQ